jgi:hypothetical protein
VLNKYPGLVEEFGRLLQRTLAEVKYPEGRTESRLLSVLPKSTIAYGAVSNYGDSTRQLLKIFHEELRDSEPLRKWWGSGEVGTSGPKVEAFLEKFVQFEEYLGNEAVFSGTMEGKEPKFFLLSEVRKPGLKEFLEKWTLELGEKGKPMGRVVDAQGLKGLKNVHSAPDPIWLVRPDYLLMGDDGEAMGALAARLDTKNRDFPATAFGQRVIKAYEGGATILAAADLQGILNTALAGDKAAQKILQDSGFENMKYAVWEHAGKAGEEVSKAELSFAGPRHGIASWLEKPTSLDSLDFSSPETILAISLVLKDPAKLYDEAKEMAAASNANTFAAVPMMEQSLKFSLRDDLLGELGGELTLEVD